jgi:hypothetical protein
MLSVIMLSVIMLSVILLNVAMLNVVMLSVVILSVVMLCVVILSVVMLSVVAPSFDHFQTEEKILFAANAKRSSLFSTTKRHKCINNIDFSSSLLCWYNSFFLKF